MCGRYSLFPTQADFESRFDVRFETSFEPRYNAAPGQQLPVITDTDPDRVQSLEWGFVPRWADTTDESYINARSETIEEKPAFADAYEHRRCLVPADGFYEWVDSEDGKQPYRVAFDDDRLFAMAGLWERWTPKTKQTGLDDFTGGTVDDEPQALETFTILTTEPNEIVEQLHHRMAVILAPDEEDAWLAGDDVSFDLVPTRSLHSYPVSTAVNNPMNDDPKLIEAIR